MMPEQTVHLETSHDTAHLGAVHEISMTCDAPGDIKEFFNRLYVCAHRFQNMKKRQIDPQTDPPMPKVVWKILTVRQSIIYRTVELQNAVSILVNANNLLGALIMTRTLVELMVFVGDLREKVARAVDEHDLSKLDLPDAMDKKSGRRFKTI